MSDDVKYLGLSKESFLNLKIIPCDIYKEEEKSIVKISSKGDNVSEEVFDGIEDVLVVVDDFIAFSEVLIPDVYEEIKNFQPNAHLSLYHICKQLGIDQELVTSVINKLTETKFKGNQLINISLKRFHKSINSYIYNHTYLLAILLVAFSRRQKWYSDSIEMKIIQASLLHDLEISDQKNLFYESQIDTETFEQLPNEVKNDLIDHSKLISDSYSSIKEYDPDVLKMIKYHHYTPSQLLTLGNSERTELVVFFRIFHDFVTELYKVSFNTDKLKHAFFMIHSKYEHIKFKNNVLNFSLFFDLMILKKSSHD